MESQEKVNKASVHYRMSEETHECGNCGMFTSKGLSLGECDLVKGIIWSGAICDKWTPK